MVKGVGCQTIKLEFSKLDKAQLDIKDGLLNIKTHTLHDFFAEALSAVSTSFKSIKQGSDYEGVVSKGVAQGCIGMLGNRNDTVHSDGA